MSLSLSFSHPRCEHSRLYHDSLSYSLNSVLIIQIPPSYASAYSTVNKYNYKMYDKSSNGNHNIIHQWRRIATVCILIIAVIISSPIILLASPILHLLHQPHRIIHLTQQYLYILLLGLPFLIGFETQKRTLQSQQKIWPI